MKTLHIFIWLKIAEIAAVILIPLLTGFIFGYYCEGTWGEPVWLCMWFVGLILDGLLFLSWWFLKSIVTEGISDLVKWNWKLARKLSK